MSSFNLLVPADTRVGSAKAYQRKVDGTDDAVLLPNTLKLRPTTSSARTGPKRAVPGSSKQTTPCLLVFSHPPYVVAQKTCV